MDVKIYAIIFVLVIIIFLIGLFFYFKDDTSSKDFKGKTMSYDNSDVPIPPSTLEYNKSLAPPKRNCNILSSGHNHSLKKKHYDLFDLSYYSIPDELNYKL